MKYALGVVLIGTVIAGGWLLISYRTGSQEMPGEVSNPEVIITSYSLRPDAGVLNDMVVWGSADSSEGMLLTVVGEVRNVRYSRVTYDGEQLVPGEVIAQLSSLRNATILIGTTIPEGVPNEIITWQSISGKEYSFTIGADGVTGEIEKRWAL